MGDTEKISVLILSLKKVHCKIIGYTDMAKWLAIRMKRAMLRLLPLEYI